MTNDTRDNGPLSGGIGIGMMWDAEGNVLPPLTEAHERLDRKVQKAKRRWEKSGLESDYDRFAELEERLDRAIDKAREDYNE